MKKIGVIDKVELSGPGTKNIIYKNPQLDGYKNISYLSANVCDVVGVTMKKVEPEYNRKGLYFLGDIIEYDEETNTINNLDSFKKLTENEINQINYIYHHYMKIANDRSNFKSIIQSLSNCTSIGEISQQLNLKKDLFDGKINAEIIIESIRKQMLTMRNLQRNNTTWLKR